MLDIILVEDNSRLRSALRSGLQAADQASVVFDCDQGEAALEYCLEAQPELSKTVILMDVQLAGGMNGIQAAVADAAGGPEGLSQLAGQPVEQGQIHFVHRRQLQRTRSLFQSPGHRRHPAAAPGRYFSP